MEHVFGTVMIVDEKHPKLRLCQGGGCQMTSRWVGVRQSNPGGSLRFTAPTRRLMDGDLRWLFQLIAS